eukprot:gene13945-biopygen4871
MVEALGRVEAGQPLSASGAPTASSRHGDAGRASLSLPNNGGTRWDEGGMREYGIPDPPRHVPATPTKHLQDVDDGTDFLSDQRRRLPRVAYPQAGSRSWLAYPQAGSRSWLAYPQAGSRSWLAYPQAGSRSCRLREDRRDSSRRPREVGALPHVAPVGVFIEDVAARALDLLPPSETIKVRRYQRNRMQILLFPLFNVAVAH